MNLFTALGAINMFLAVALGAFGAHGLESRLPADAMSTYQTAVQYHLIHGLGLVLISLIAQQTGAALVGWAGWSLLAGIILFSGSLYVLSISGVSWLGAITPLGGLAFLLGWGLLAYAAFA